MTEHSIDLPESIYLRLVSAAEKKGLTPADWIASKLPLVAGNESQPLSDLLSGLTGTINSKADLQNGQQLRVEDAEDGFGEAVVAKMAEQGIYLP